MALLAFAPACAALDVLDQVRGVLDQLKGSSAVEIKLERQVFREQKDKPREEGRTQLAVSAGPAGLTVVYPPSELQRAEAEKRQSDPDQAKPASMALESLDAVELSALTNYATNLSRMLEGAKLKGRSAAAYEGKPAQLLELELAVPLSTSARKHINSASSSMKLWVAEDGTPLSLESQAVFKGRIFLIGFEASEFHSRKFTLRGDRLITVREERRNQGSGFGESSKDGRITVIQLPGEAAP